MFSSNSRSHRGGGENLAHTKNLDEQMHGFQVSKLVVVRIYADAEVEPSISSIHNLVRSELVRTDVSTWILLQPTEKKKKESLLEPLQSCFDTWYLWVPPAGGLHPGP